METPGTFTSGHLKVLIITGVFVAFTGADYNKCLWIYKITRFSYCFGKEWVVVVAVAGGGGLMWTFTRGGGGGGEVTKIE